MFYESEKKQREKMLLSIYELKVLEKNENAFEKMLLFFLDKFLGKIFRVVSSVTITLNLNKH